MWNVVLDPKLEQRARDCVRHLVSLAVSAAAEPLPATTLADHALLFSYFAIYQQSWKYTNLAIERLNSATGDLSMDLPLGIHGGLCHIGWIIQHLNDIFVQNRPTIQSADDVLAELDISLLECLRAGPWRGPYDLIDGLVGIGLYFLERHSSAKAKEAVLTVVRLLSEAAVSLPEGGIAWWTDENNLTQIDRDNNVRGYYNLGVAHGIPGTIGFLARVTQFPNSENAMQLLLGSMHFLLSQQRRRGAKSLFPNWTPVDCRSMGSRIAWCYGDLGIAGVLHGVSIDLSREDWREFSLQMAERCIQRGPDRVIDAGLCHGSAGIAHIYNHFYQVEHSLLFKDAANYYFDLTLSHLSSLPSSSEFLEGGAGIALALMSALEPIEPQWDRLLLLSGARL